MSKFFSQTKVAKVASLVLGIAMLAFVFVPQVRAQTGAELQALLDEIARLTAQVTSLQGGAPSVPSTGSLSGFTFTRNLKQGDTGTDVKNLQMVLNSDPMTQVASTGVGSPGNESTFFGALTKAAVIKFQEKYASDILTPIGLTNGTGTVGPATRAKLNTWTAGPVVDSGSGCGPGVLFNTVTGQPCTTPGPVTPGCPAGALFNSMTGQPCTTTSPTGTGLTVTAGQQPINASAPFGAARVPFTKLMLTAGNDGDVTVNSIEVLRGGVAADANFSGVVLLDENGLQIGIAKTLNSNHMAVVGEPFVVRAGTTKMVTIAGNIAASGTASAGQVPQLIVTKINTTATVNGSLPISGAVHSIVSITLGSVTNNISSFDPNTSATKEIGTTGYKFAGVRFTAGSAEDIRLWSIRWNQSGSASSNDLGNVKVVVDGVGTFDTMVSADGKYYTATFPGGIKFDKGLSRDIYIQGDIVGSGSAGRTVKFDIYKTTDVYFSGESFGYGLTPPVGAGTASDSTSEFTASTPWFDGSKVTVSAGSATTIGKAVSVAAQNIAVNVSNQVLGGYTTDIKGEPISVQSSVFTVASTTGSGYGLLTNVSIYDENGAVVAGPVDATYTSALVQTLTFTDTITYPIGMHTYTIKGKVASTIGNGGTYIVSSTPSSGWTNVTGQVTGNTISLSGNGAFSMNTMTVKSAALAITVSPTPAAATIVPGGQSRTFANYQLDASQSGEDVRFSSIPLQLTYGGSAVGTSLSSCQVFDGTTVLNSGSNIVNPSTSASPQSQTFTFDSALVIPKGTVKVLVLKCNVASAAVTGNTFSWGIAASPSITVTGVTSSADVTETVTASAGQTQTIGAGTLTITTDSNSPSYGLVAAGTTGNVVGSYKFRSTNEAINLNRLGLKLTNTASSSASDIVQVTIWDGSTQVGSAVFTGANTVATSTFSTPVNLPKDVDKVLTVKADFASIGTGQPAVSGHLIAVDVNASDTTGTEGTGVDSGTTINLATSGSSASTAVSGVRLFKSYPTMAKLSLPTNILANGTKSLLRFRVTAASTGDVGVAKFSIKVATTTATVTGLNINAFTDSGFSTPVSGLSSNGQMLASDLAGTVWASSATQVEITAQTSAAASTTIQIPAGQSRYFDVYGSVSGSASGASISTQLEGDAAYPSLSGFMSTFNGINADSNNDFIWSPNSTTTVTTNGFDWTNGYGIVGLPGVNMSAEVLSP